MEASNVHSVPQPTASRRVTRVVRGVAASDGAGVRLTRVIGGPMLPDLDPFLLLDEFRSDDAGDYIAGFPDHPHRGFETVTYMLAGRMRHGDNQGNSGLLGPGSVQWMTAARGIVHSEMPEQQDGLMWGFQLWVNLPARDKMTCAALSGHRARAHTADRARGGSVAARDRRPRGRYRGPVSGVATSRSTSTSRSSPACVTRWTCPPRTTPLPMYTRAAWRQVRRTKRARCTVASLVCSARGASVALTGGAQGGRLILVAGKPLHEPVARYGPFVMNTEAELHQAFADYRAGRF